MSQTRTPRAADSQERARYFPRQVVTPPDLAQDQVYFLHRLRVDNRVFHGFGVKQGLQVAAIDSAKARELVDATILRKEDNVVADWLAIKAGYALTPQGDVIYLPNDVYVDTAHEHHNALVTSGAACHCLAALEKPRTGVMLLVVEACEEEARPVQSASNRCGDHPDQFEFSRIKDTVRFRLIEEKDLVAPFASPEERLTGKAKRNYVCLAKITFKGTPEVAMTVPPRDELSGTSPLPVPTPPPEPEKCEPSWLQRIWAWLKRHPKKSAAAVAALAAVLAYFAWPSRYAPELITPPLPPPLPLFGDGTNNLLHFGRYQAVHVVWATTAPKIDGYLDEWDQSSGFRSALPVPYDKHYFLEGYLMMDDNYLYFGAHVGDPYPLMNNTGKDSDISAGGSVSIHLSSKDDVDATEFDPSNPYFRIEVWKEGDVPRLRTVKQKGKKDDFYGPVEKGNDFDGVFRKDQDGRGYTLEYRLSWKSLEAMEVPKDGAFRAMCWDVHWSDHTGKKVRARLAEIINPRNALLPENAGALTYMTPALWGKAIFHRK